MIKKQYVALFGLLALALVFLVAPVLSHAQTTTIPTVGTSDIAAVGAAVLSPLITDGEYIMEQFGPPLLALAFVIGVFLAIRSYVGRKKPGVY